MTGPRWGLFWLVGLAMVLGGCASGPALEAGGLGGALEAPPRHAWPAGRPVPVVLDADTANEIDDLFAIAYALPDSSVEVLGLTSAQWFHVWSGDSTVYQSQRLNEDLLALAGRTDLPHPLGADVAMGAPWGGREPRDSPAARFIVEQARARPPGERLAVVALGATTNVASALALAPDIRDKVVVYLLGFQYDAERGVWDKDEFNIRRDLNAANFLLDLEGLELHVMPTTVARQATWSREDTFRRLGRAGAMGVYLRAAWERRFPEYDTWVMWDVALVQAVFTPEWATETAVATPPENVARRVWTYTDVDEDAMARAFWSRLENAYGPAGD